MPALGGACWHGYSFTGGDTGSAPLPADFAMCGAGCMLHITGTVGAATEANAYAGIVFMGFNVAQAAGAATKGTVTPTGTGLVVTYTNTSATPVVRFQIQSGSSASTRWCAPLTGSPATIPYTSFNTECWEGGAGVAYAKQAIDQAMLVIPGGAAAAAVDITLTSVTEM